MRNKIALTALVAVAATAMAGQALAAEHKIQMLNSGPGGTMVFSPAAVKAKPGDTLRFLPTEPGHNAETIAGMIPAGAATVKGAMNKEVVYTLSKPGTYGFKCAPHYGMGMVFVAKVGDGKPNLAEAQAAAGKAPPFAKKRFTAAFAGLQ